MRAAKLKEDYSFIRGVCYGVPYYAPVEQVKKGIRLWQAS